jgi:hypothetical protein
MSSGFNQSLLRMYQDCQFEVSSISVIDFGNVTQYSLFQLMSEVEAAFGVTVYVSLALKKKKLQILLTVCYISNPTG